MSGKVRGARPTLRGVCFFVAGVLALLAAAGLGSMELLFLGLALTILPLAAVMMVAFSRPAITVSRSLGPHVIASGGTTDVSLRLENLTGRTIAATSWRDAMPPAVAVQEVREFPARQGRSVLLEHSIQVDSRGVYPIGPLIVQVHDPFGLAFGEHALGSSRDLIVTPAVSDLPGLLVDIASSDGMARAALLHSSPSAVELMAREYRPGDPLRRVHWGATARHGELMVRQEEQRNNPEAWIVLDTLAQLEPTEGNPAFERAIELVASLGMHLLDEGFTVGLVCTGPDQLSARSGERQGRGGAAPMFQLPAGDQHLLRGLAETNQSASGEPDSGAFRLLDGMHLSGHDAMVFAVVVDGPDEMIEAIAAVRSPSKPAIAFLAGSSVERSGVLTNAGWNCIRLDRDGVLGAWDAAIAALGARDG